MENQNKEGDLLDHIKSMWGRLLSLLKKLFGVSKPVVKGWTNRLGHHVGRHVDKKKLSKHIREVGTRFPSLENKWREIRHAFTVNPESSPTKQSLAAGKKKKARTTTSTTTRKKTPRKKTAAKKAIRKKAA